jgi:hypothetical protein
MQGSEVAGLQDALLLLIERQLIKTFAPPERPTVEELQGLSQRLKQEQTQSTFGDAMQQLVRYVQNQQGLGDQLAGVEATTAAVLNWLLTSLGALTPTPSFVVSGRVYSGDRAGVGGLRVQVADKNVGPDVLLAEGKTVRAIGAKLGEPGSHARASIGMT